MFTKDIVENFSGVLESQICEVHLDNWKFEKVINAKILV